MTRLLPLLIAVGLLAGCTASGLTPPFDPFSPTTIEPPRTGWIQREPPGDPYYSGPREATSADPVAVASSQWTRRSPPSGQAREPLSRPEGRQPEGRSTGPPRESAPPASGDRITIPLAAREAPELSGTMVGPGQREPRSSQPGDYSLLARSEREGPTGQSWSGLGRHTAATPARGWDSVVQTNPTRPRNPDRSPHGSLASKRQGPSRTEPQRLPEQRGAIDIMDLPPAQSNQGASARPKSQGIRLVSATERVSAPAARGASFGRGTTGKPAGGSNGSFSPRARYGHDPDYRWLKGRLEYSQVGGRWKLRYIPIDGHTDQFGGSVMLASPALVSGYEQGDFVEVVGSLNRQGQGEQGFAPKFEIREIKPSAG